MQAQKRHILLLQDNISGHKVPKNLTNVVVENFLPNLTAHIQPMDAGVIRFFKARFRRFSMQRALDRYDTGVTPVDIYNIDQLQAMRLAEQAWGKVTQGTIANCWRKSGILPTADTASDDGEDSDSPDSCVLRVSDGTGPIPADPALQQAEAALPEVLGEFQEVRVLQRKNVIDIEDLINMPEEQIVEDATDEEIVEAVQRARASAEEGGDDGEEDTELKPSRKEALQAAATLGQYIADLDGPFARRMEVVLSSFGRETRREEAQTMVETNITDYFKRT
jgi:hypothetical protein